MAKDSFARKFIGTGLAVAGAAGLYAYVIRPWMLRWGATQDELSCTLPGDELVPYPNWSFTHAVTIHTDPDEIWPWLVQWGYQRGGFYSYDWLDDMLGANGVKSADHILLEYQSLQPGDTLPVEPHGGGFLVEQVEEQRYILLSNRLDLLTRQRFEAGKPPPRNHVNLTWLWYLKPMGGCRTRLISRSRVEIAMDRYPAMNIFIGEPLKPGSAIMDWGMLQGIKRRAEEAGCVPNDQ